MTDGPEPNDSPEELSDEQKAIRQAMGGLDDLPRLPDPDEAMEERMRRLEERASGVRVRREAVKKEADRQIKSTREANRGLGLGMMIAYTLLGLPLAGAAVGWFLDRGTGGQFWTSLLVLLGAVGGIVFTAVTMNRNAS